MFRRYNSIAPLIYENTKIHKSVIPLRPIVSDIQGSTTNLASYIAQVLRVAYDPKNDYVKNTFEFAKSINKFKLPPNHIVISLDVINLFENIIKHLVFEAVKQKWNHIKHHCQIAEDKFMNILEFSTILMRT